MRPGLKKPLHLATTTFLLGTVLLLSPASAGPPPATDISQVIMYGVDDNTSELVRYNFATDEYVRIGVVTDQDGYRVEDLECLAHVPSGPHKGFYAVANFLRAAPVRLVKIDPLTARAYMYPDPVVDWALADKVEGLVAFPDPDTGEWQLWGTTERAGSSSEYLLDIDMDLGVETRKVALTKNVEGLARDSTGQLFGVSKSPVKLFKIDVAPDFSSANLYDARPITGGTKTEALEFAFGDAQPDLTISLPGVDPSWTTNGMLFGFDDDNDALWVINPNNADQVQFPSAFDLIDCEGLVFTTARTDPVFGAIAGFD